MKRKLSGVISLALLVSVLCAVNKCWPTDHYSSRLQSALSLQDDWGLTPPLVEDTPVVENAKPWVFIVQNPSGDKTFWREFDPAVPYLFDK